MITVHAGQCGNQLGYCLLDTLYEHILNNEIHLELYFHSSSNDNLNQCNFITNLLPIQLFIYLYLYILIITIIITIITILTNNIITII